MVMLETGVDGEEGIVIASERVMGKVNEGSISCMSCHALSSVYCSVEWRMAADGRV